MSAFRLEKKKMAKLYPVFLFFFILFHLAFHCLQNVIHPSNFKRKSASDKKQFCFTSVKAT